ncbi:GNAT family N-acetyltransferase [Streptomyces albus]|uniref:GNAT family N-acetyltransferase n=1 Tax=Streptomyces albus TaxID=1888 RepID=UPI0013B4883C|nr:GNAT family N-acetyltransferase [Streptomyces albus]QID35486.1 GNAT family N-acetyltransferase [Streptomyces albus]
MLIIDLPPGDPRLSAVLPVLRELRPHMTDDLFHELYAEGHRQGLRFTAAFTEEGEGAEAPGGGECLARAPGCRRPSSGVGRELLAHLEERARASGCRTLSLDSGTQRLDAHRFYMRQGMGIAAFHFTKQSAGD